ncbi:BMP family ABC transporter substrate-binding protein [uncultured Corynebacterium sp.]|uniref:BMP family ABC transporter substrate-binding protein n=1 Tax=uncultured Corynebacterium sp. TaxID=159447 RepID=UPI00259AF79E|nr:BMP family ABC transporter substrate-binding protein [uncultured Corynebacterium sp.]
MVTSKAKYKLAALVGTAALALSLAACSEEGEAGSGGGEGGSGGPTYIYLTNDPIGVNKFLESGKIGVEQAAEQNGGTAKVYEGSSEQTSIRQNMDQAVSESPDYIVTITFAYTDVAFEYAERYPDQKFIHIDDCPDEPYPPNMYCAVFREHEAAYLLGYEAGLLTETNNIGSVGAVDIPFIHRYTDAFAQGAKDANPDVADQQLFIGGDSPFSDPARAKEQAAALVAQDVDHIFAVASGSNGGVFEATGEGGVTGYGVDVNQCSLTPGGVGDGTLKLMDTLIPQLIADIDAGTADQFSSFGLAEGGMDIVSLAPGAEDSQCTVMEHPEVVEQLATIKQQIIDGEITPPDATGKFN